LLNSALALVHRGLPAANLRLVSGDLWDESAGFEDAGGIEALKRLRPLNLYGWSKHVFDCGRCGRQKQGEHRRWGQAEILEFLRAKRNIG
jgi:hypothetical protein